MYHRSFLFLGFLFCICFLVSCHSSNTSKRVKSTLTVSTEHEPQSLDPRQVRDVVTTTTIHMLYEGLMRLQAEGKIVPALAESVAISPDQKTYTFKLRSSGWSNGQQVTAYDFESTWKSLLDPQFITPIFAIHLRLFMQMIPQL
jgi:oligopeptide transport system substrate-binding protein